MKLIPITLLATSLMIAADKEGDANLRIWHEWVRKIHADQQRLVADQKAAQEFWDKKLVAHCKSIDQQIGMDLGDPVCMTPQPSPPPNTNSNGGVRR